MNESRSRTSKGEHVWRIFIGLAFAFVLVGESALTTAIAQNANLIAKLATLTLRKGTPLLLGSTCAKLGLPQAFDDCRVLHSPFKDTQDVGHAVAVLIDPEFRSSIILLEAFPETKKSFLISLHGNLLAAAVYRPSPVATWSTVSVAAPETQGEVTKEMAYWRTKLAELANEPDRKD